MPTVHAVQAETSAALHRAFHSGKFEKLPTHSVADSICVDVPSNGLYALARLKKYNGAVVTVADETIIEAQAALARSTGLFTEPAGAAAYAGFLKVKETLAPEAVVVILATGNGLKDNATALKGVVFPTRSIRSIDEI
jgi:threonine synthase